MNNIVRFVFFPIFFSFFLISSTWAAIPNLVGTYEVVSAKYLAPKLANCAVVTITVKITKQCGRLLKGSITMSGTTIPVIGRLTSNNKDLLLTGNAGPGYQYFVLGGTYQSLPTAIKVGGYSGGFTSGIDSFPEDAEFEDFTLAKKP